MGAGRKGNRTERKISEVPWGEVTAGPGAHCEQGRWGVYLCENKLLPRNLPQALGEAHALHNQTRVQPPSLTFRISKGT